MASALFPTYVKWDIEIVKGKGTQVIDSTGKEYLDFYSGIAVCNLGHCHDGVKEALKEQLDTLWHVSNLCQQSIQEEVAVLLTNECHSDAVFFCNSGAEANEAAIKLARKYTGREKIISFVNSFHGRTFAAMSVTGQEKVHKGFGTLLSECCYVPFNDIAAFQKEINEEVAAVVVEIVQGEGGVIPINQQFLETVSTLCKQYGALLIVDEVQTGIGRTGTFFAHTQYNISPDIISVAKGLGNGFPIGAMIGKKELVPSFGTGAHGSTFGGNMLAMTAAKEVIKTISEGSFLQEVREKAAYFQTELKKRLALSELVKDVRGVGFLIGIECVEKTGPFITKLQEKGLLTVGAGEYVIRLLPPLTVSYEELDTALDVLEVTLQGKVGVK